MVETELQTALRARIAHNHRSKGRPFRCSQDQIDAALRRYADGESAAPIAKELGVATTTLLRWAKKVAETGIIP